MNWENEFKKRLNSFEKKSSVDRSGRPVSIKVRVAGGCFHRQHSPKAYKIIDDYLISLKERNFDFEEHESGPELLAYINLGANIVTILAGIATFVGVILKARAEGIRKGDGPDSPLELIIRDYEQGQVREEKLLKIDSRDSISNELITEVLLKGTSNLVEKPKAKKKHLNTAIITSDYRITIPKGIREQFKIERGQKLELTVEKGIIKIVQISPKNNAKK